MKSRLISLMLAICVLFSVMPAAAYFAVGEPIAETGVIIDYTFDEFPAVTDYMYKNNKGGKMLYSGGSLGSEGTNTYWAPIINGNSFTHALRDVNKKELKDVINTGKLKWEFDVKYPKGEDLTEDNKSFVYFYTQSYDAFQNNATSERAYTWCVEYKNDAPIMTFGIKDISSARPSANSDGSNVFKMEFDKWYTVTIIYDYDLKEANYYIDGELFNYYQGDASKMQKQFAYYVGGFTQGGLANKNFACIDNVLVERLSGGNINAAVYKTGDNYIDVKFDAGIDKGIALDPDDYELKILGEVNVITANSAELISSDVLRLTFAEDFEKNVNYELTLNGTLHETGNVDKFVKVGTKLLFVTEGEAVERILVEQNFEDITFPTEETSADFDAFYYQAAGSEGDFTTQKDLTYKYVQSTQGSADNGTVLQFSHLTADGRNSRKSLVFPFAEGLTAKSGIVEIDFEAAIDTSSTGYFELAFGLHDSANPATTYNYNTTWADATQFAGLVHSSYKEKYLVPAITDARGHVASVWKDGVGTGEQASWWNTKYILVPGILYRDATDALDKFKIKINLDDDMFEIYYNGDNVYTSNYLPGNVTNGVYDAFVLTALRGGSSATSAAYFDNLTIKHVASVSNAVTSIGFEKYDGTKYTYGDLLPAGIKTITIDFNNELFESSVDANIIIDGAGDSYNVDVEGTKAILTFDNCLTANTEYTITVKGDILDKSEMPLGRDVVFTVNTDEGEVIYKTPVVEVNNQPLDAASSIALGDTITVEAEFINTTPDKKGSYVVLLAYKDSYLKGVAYSQYVADGTSPYTDTLTITKAADEAFVGADAVKAFVFDNISDLKPLTDAFVAE